MRLSNTSYTTDFEILEYGDLFLSHVAQGIEYYLMLKQNRDANPES